MIVIGFMKKSTLIATLSSILTILILYTLIDASFVAPKKCMIRNELLSSNEIDEQLNDIKITYFSDVEYGEFIDGIRLEKITNIINSTNSDIVLFGGDLIGESIILNNEQKDRIVEHLSNIKAPLGKFAVLGDNDCYNEQIKNDIENILIKADFEILHNESLTIRNKDAHGFNIIGVENGINSNVSLDTAYENISANSYTLVFGHTPDVALDLNEEKTDYYISGHSHGGQMNFLFYSLYHPENTNIFFRGKKNYNENFIVDVSSGVGTTKKDIRLGANAEIVLFTLQHEEIEEVPITIQDLTEAND